MRFPGFIGPSYTSASVNYDCQRCINLYPEMDEMGTGKEHEVGALVGTPGLKLLAKLGTGPIRGMWYTSTGVFYVVSGGTLYRVASNWVATSIGTLNTIVGQVSMCDNGFQLVIVDGFNGYYVNLGTDTYTFTVTPGNTASVGDIYTNNGQNFIVKTKLAVGDTTLVAYGSGTPQASGRLSYSINNSRNDIVFSAVSSVLYNNAINTITDANFTGSNVVTYQDGYFIFAKPNSKQFYISDLKAITFTSPSVQSKEGTPDNIVSLISSNRSLWVFGDQTLEQWFDSGDNLNPFQYAAGTLRQYGCAAMFSVAKLVNTVFWLGKDSTGKGIVFMANGAEPQRISTHAVERAISGYSTISDATAFAYQENGHQFYVLSFPTGNSTWVFDTTTSLWHERAYNNNGTLERIRGYVFAYPFGVQVVGDYANGNIYNLSSTTYTDNLVPIIRQRVSPHISQDMNRIFISRFQLDVETGVGVDGGTQGINPQAMLRWSDDGGHTWSNEHWISIGSIGSYRARAIWRRLGRSRNRVFSVSISDPVKVAMIGAELDLAMGAS